ncbi:unnamed protein product [Linum trigynum]|uniref:RNase H type-1 domain-containing protein n=1 Tax=Linum trigynum TaxID=586398 RepID=A0AAV2G4X0_9ROSI
MYFQTLALPLPRINDYLKIKFDAVVRDSGCSSGLVIRGSDGHVVVSAGLCHQRVFNPNLSELLAVRDAITFVASRSLTYLIVEGDSEVVVNQIRQSVLEDSTGGFGAPRVSSDHRLFVNLFIV